ncbi:MAG: hypothetical protein SynsKO_05790 [Synoicihabitans sp.]
MKASEQGARFTIESRERAPHEQLAIRSLKHIKHGPAFDGRIIKLGIERAVCGHPPQTRRAGSIT